MAGGHLGALGQVLQNPLGEHFTHQTQVPVVGQHAVHVQGNAAAFLAAVLQGVQCAVYGADHVGLAGLVINAENAAFFMQCIGGGKFKHFRNLNPENAEENKSKQCRTGTKARAAKMQEMLAQQALHDFLVSVGLAAHVAAEQILVQMGAGGGIPEAAGVGADLVGQDDGAIGQTAELQLEVDQTDVGIQQDLLQHFVDLEGVLGDGVDLFLGGQIQGQGVVVVDERIMQIVVLVAELQDRGLEGSTLGHAHAQAEVAGSGRCG